MKSQKKNRLGDTKSRQKITNISKKFGKNLENSTNFKKLSTKLC
jgi:hypothetical protein